MPPVWFNNYEIVKLAVRSPSLANFAILVILGLVVLASIRRSSAPFAFLDRSQTEPLRGIAILLIMLGHLWVHVSQRRADPVFSGEAVAIFFVLSGYGLTVSMRRGNRSLRHFVSHRIRRVMVPYWLATILLVALDAAILRRTYSAKDLVLTSLGFNFSPAVTSIDYVRWYLSLLLLWYILFYVANALLDGAKALVALFVVGFLIFFLSYYKLNIGWYQVLGFPVGCLLGHGSEGIGMVYSHRRSALVRLALAGILWVVSYKVVFGISSVRSWLLARVPNIIFNFILEVNGIVLCLGLVVLLAQLARSGRRSALLLFFGAYSYELFLLHGAFLVKYDFIIRRPDTLSVIGSFLVFIAFASLIAIGLNRLARLIDGKLSRKAPAAASG
jgi:peptidoglycan/LPS O-acetylase OafA/YrhL